MNFDRFKDVKLNLDSTAEYDADYVASLNTLKKQPKKKSILPIIGTVAAAILIIVGVTAWALIGRSIRGHKPKDDPIVPADTSNQQGYPFEDITDTDVASVTFTLREHSSHKGISKTFSSARAITETIGYLKKVSAYQSTPPLQNVGSFTPYVVTLADKDGSEIYCFSIYRYSDEKCYCYFKQGNGGDHYLIEDGSLNELLLYIATIDGREAAWNYHSPLSDVIASPSDIKAIIYNGNEYTDSLDVRTVASLTSSLPMRKPTDSDEKWNASSDTATIEYIGSDGNTICKIVADLYSEDSKNYNIKLYTDGIDGERYLANKKHFDALVTQIKERFTQKTEKDPTTPDSDGADIEDGDKPADTPTVSRPDSNTGDGAGSYVDDYVAPETLKADREYADYLIKIRDTAGAMLIKGKKTDGTFTVTASFIGSAKVGDKITVQALPDSENEYMLALKPKGAEYVGIAKEWQFEITPEYKTDDSFNHEKLESTTQMRLFNDYIYSYRDKSYVPPLSDGDIRTGLGSWRTVLQDDGKEIAFKYAEDFFPHHTKFANVDIYSTPSTKKEVLLVYEKPGPTDGQVSYKRRYVELCELPEQMKNDPYYDMYIVEHIDGRREMFRRGKQPYAYYNECFRYTEGNTLKDTLYITKDYLGYDLTTAEAISSIRAISSDNDDIRVTIDNKADVKRLYDALAKSSYSVNNIPKDLNSCNVVINLIRSDPYYAYTIWVNLDTGITRCGYKLDDDAVRIIKELI